MTTAPAGRSRSLRSLDAGRLPLRPHGGDGRPVEPVRVAAGGGAAFRAARAVGAALPGAPALPFRHLRWSVETVAVLVCVAESGRRPYPPKGGVGFPSR